MELYWSLRLEKYVLAHLRFDASTLSNSTPPLSVVTCPESCLHLIYSSSVLPQRTSLQRDRASHADRF